jgi:hypothetical protein
VPSRIAARLLTGPLAFLLGGVLDLAAFAALAWRERARRRISMGRR